MRAIGAAITFVLVPLVACGSSPSSHSTSALHDSSVTIASFDFPESEVLARIYAGAVRGAGIAVHVVAPGGPRELLEPALQQGVVELVPEYAGTAVQFLSLDEVLPSSDPDRTHRDLVEQLGGTPVVALSPARAQDANALVVTAETARRYDLNTVSDLGRVASKLVLGGPPECPHRPFCLAGFAQTYGLRFGEFIPLDVGGPLTVQALVSGDIDVGLLFTSDPAIGERHLVRLRDDRGLQPAENVTPLVRSDTLDRFGPGLREAIDGVSARLTTDALVSLNTRLRAGESPSRVADQWLTEEGLS